MKCDYEKCGKELRGAIIHDHGKRYHPDCYAEVCKAKMKEYVEKFPRDDRDHFP